MYQKRQKVNIDDTHFILLPTFPVTLPATALVRTSAELTL